MDITTPRLPLIVGEQATLTCTCASHLNVTRIEWEYNGVSVAVNVTGVTVELTFDPVNDSIHDRLYICRVITTAGRVLSDSVTVTVSGKSKYTQQFMQYIVSGRSTFTVIGTSLSKPIGDDINCNCVHTHTVVLTLYCITVA